MEVSCYRTCHVPPDIASLYIHFCKENEINFEASEDGDLIYITFCDTATKIKELNNWILKVMYNQEAKHV